MTDPAHRASRVRAVLIGALVVTAAVAGIAQSPQTQTPEAVRGRWNAVFAEGAPGLDRAPSALLRDSIRGQNAMFLAKAGWSVTGIDISEVAVANRRLGARRPPHSTGRSSRGLRSNAVVDRRRWQPSAARCRLTRFLLRRC
jgi:hypothetical protein